MVGDIQNGLTPPPLGGKSSCAEFLNYPCVYTEPALSSAFACNNCGIFVVTREQLLSIISVTFLWKSRDIPLLSFLYLDKLLLNSYLLGEEYLW